MFGIIINIGKLSYMQVYQAPPLLFCIPCLIEKKMSIEETVQESQIDSEIVKRIYQMHEQSKHKRSAADTLWVD